MTIAAQKIDNGHVYLSQYFYFSIMSDRGYKIRNQQAVHFVTFAVVGWIDVFSRQQYRDIFLDKVRQSQKDSGMLIHAWVLMSNHFHGVMSAGEGFELSNILGELKRKSSIEISLAIEKNDSESRREWMLELFHRAGNINARNTKRQFWQQDNHPKECFGKEFTMQKINYIHQNPVRAGIVDHPDYYLYSSARNYSGEKGLLDIDFLW
jgi:REP element-mobilizing transposase RayT